MKHNIIQDRAGWGNYPRLTCLICDATLLKKPYMNTAQWLGAVKDFSKEHPEETLQRYIQELEALKVSVRS